MTFDGPGLLVLADIAQPSRWAERIGLDLMTAAGFEPGTLLPPSLHGPATLVVVIGAADAKLLTQWTGCLQAADHLIVLASPVAEGVSEAIAALDNVRASLPWQGPSDHHSLRAALRTALQYHEPRMVNDAAGSTQPALAPTDWRSIPKLSAYSHASIDDLVEAVAFGLGSAGHWIENALGQRVDLQSGIVRGKPNERARFHHDPWGRVQWGGGRCVYTWRLDGQPWARSEHDWPVGHGRKLWGIKSNDSVRWTLSPQGDAAISHYEHDALITAGLPVRWRRCGVFSVATRFADPFRAVFYGECDDWDPQYPDGFNPSIADDEDGRGYAPTLALGVNAERQYALALHRPVWRVLDQTAEQLPAGGWAIFDRQHQPVQRFDGELLGGSAGVFFSVIDRQLHRVDALTGVAQATGIEIVSDVRAVPVQTTPNLVLIQPGQTTDGVCRRV